MRYFGKCIFITPKGKLIDLGYAIQVPSVGDKIAIDGVPYRVVAIQPSIFGNISWEIHLAKWTNVNISDIGSWFID